jgi:hypothetical protein
MGLALTALLSLALTKGHLTHDTPGDATYAGVALRGATRTCAMGDELCEVCGVLSQPTRLRGVTLAPGVVTCFTTASRRSPAPYGLLSGALAVAQTLDDIAMPPGTQLDWQGDRVRGARFPVPTSVKGRRAVRFAHDELGWSIDSLEPQKIGDVGCQPWTEAHPTSVRFHASGGLQSCSLIGEQRVGGMPLLGEIALDPKGRVVRGTLARPARVASVELPALATLTLESDGRLKDVVVDPVSHAPQVVVDGVPCSEGYVSFRLEFHANGRLMSCFTAPTRLQGVPVKNFVGFHPSGDLQSGTLAHGVRLATREGEVEVSEGVKFELYEGGELDRLHAEPCTSIRVNGEERGFLNTCCAEHKVKLRDAKLQPFVPSAP